MASSHPLSSCFLSIENSPERVSERVQLHKINEANKRMDGWRREGRGCSERPSRPKKIALNRLGPFPGIISGKVCIEYDIKVRVNWILFPATLPLSNLGWRPFIIKCSSTPTCDIFHYQIRRETFLFWSNSLPPSCSKEVLIKPGGLTDCLLLFSIPFFCIFAFPSLPSFLPPSRAQEEGVGRLPLPP